MPQELDEEEKKVLDYVCRNFLNRMNPDDLGNVGLPDLTLKLFRIHLLCAMGKAGLDIHPDDFTTGPLHS